MSPRALSWAAARAAAHSVGLELRTPREIAEVAPAALGRTLAAELRSLVPVPGHAASAMDGWVVAGEPPWLLGEEIRAGDAPPAEPLLEGRARPVTTGSALPPGGRGVLRSEHGIVSAGRLSRGPRAGEHEPAPGQHIRLAGEEAAAGEVLLPAGTVLTAPRLALAAVTGHDTVPVRARPLVDLAMLGDEVDTRGIPAPGRVRDAYGVQLPALLAALGAAIGLVGRVPDELGRTVSALRQGAGRLQVCTGGSARGVTDHLRGALELVGARLEIDGVEMRPGHPVILARMGTGMGAGRAVLCLPGNPMAAMVAFVSFGVPLIDGMLGRPLAELERVEIGADLAPTSTATRLVAYRRGAGSAGGAASAVPTERQGAAMLRGLAEAEGLLVVPGAGARLGDTVEALRLPW